MKKKIEISYQELESRKELDLQDQKLLTQAEDAREKAYSPYSGFRVGAAVKLSNGEVFTGNNQENSSFPAGICAERTALFAAKAIHPDADIECLVVTASGSDYVQENPVTPCGICRQVFSEYEHKQEKAFRVILASVKGKIFTYDSASYLLPFSFYATHLKE